MLDWSTITFKHTDPTLPIMQLRKSWLLYLNYQWPRLRNGQLTLVWLIWVSWSTQSHAHLDIASSKEQQISRWGSWICCNWDSTCGLTLPLETKRLAYDTVCNQACQALPPIHGRISHQLWSSAWADFAYPCHSKYCVCLCSLLHSTMQLEHAVQAFEASGEFKDLGPFNSNYKALLAEYLESMNTFNKWDDFYAACDFAWKHPKLCHGSLAADMSQTDIGQRALNFSSSLIRA